MILKDIYKGQYNGYEKTYHNNVEKTKSYYIDGIKYDDKRIKLFLNINLNEDPTQNG